MLIEYWDTVARLQERLTQNKGVESASVPNKIIKVAIINKTEMTTWKFKIVHHLSRDVQS